MHFSILLKLYFKVSSKVLQEVLSEFGNLFHIVSMPSLDDTTNFFILPKVVHKNRPTNVSLVTNLETRLQLRGYSVNFGVSYERLFRSHSCIGLLLSTTQI
nr:MAG TPA: hypothetical protein [Caudoviricetes sp.]